MSGAFTSHTTHYHLDDRKTSNWSATQERAISTSYPFDLRAAGPEDHVARTYLQFLWLPNSLMPLTNLVPSLQQVSTTPPGSSSGTVIPHAMHAFLEPLLLTTQYVSKKYHTELAQILTSGGGAGDMEEAMMWYVVEHERSNDDNDSKLVGSPHKHGESGPWTNEAWRKRYLERMEKREAQIQILLYLFKMSLPGPQPPTPPPVVQKGPQDSAKRSPKKRRRFEMDESDNTIEDHLEGFMDKLAMWQLVSRLDGALNPVGTKKAVNEDERDWIQMFAEDIVEQQFNSKLPDLCKLLRSKVFPTSPFSDTESEPATLEENASTSPTTNKVPTSAPLKQSLSRTASASFSRASSSISKSQSSFPSPTRTTRTTSTTTTTTTSTRSRALVRSRSSSLSLSLAQEQEERAAAAAAAASKVGQLNREVSMSRAFNKGKGKNKEGDAKTTDDATVKVEPPKVQKPKQMDMGITLVEETPVKARRINAPSQLVAELAPIAPLTFGVAKLLPNGSKPTSVKERVVDEEEDEDEDEWMMDGSPDVVVFDPLLLEKTKQPQTRNLMLAATASEEMGGGGGGGVAAPKDKEDSDEEWNTKCDPAVDLVQRVVEKEPITPRPARRPLKKLSRAKRY